MFGTNTGFSGNSQPAGLTNQLNQLDIDANTKNIYYSDTAPGGQTLEDGDIWFDSHNLRLNVRHTGALGLP